MQRRSAAVQHNISPVYDYGALAILSSAACGAGEFLVPGRRAVHAWVLALMLHFCLLQPAICRTALPAGQLEHDTRGAWPPAAVPLPSPAIKRRLQTHGRAAQPAVVAGGERCWDERRC